MYGGKTVVLIKSHNIAKSHMIYFRSANGCVKLANSSLAAFA